MKEAKFGVTPHAKEPRRGMIYLDQDGMYGNANGLRVIIPDEIVGGRAAFQAALDSGESLNQWFETQALGRDAIVEPIVVETTSLLMSSQDVMDSIELFGVISTPPVEPVKVIETVKAGIKAKIKEWLV